MTEQEIIQEMQSRLGGSFTVMSINTVNQDPHPYCITEKHISRNSGMYLGKEQIESMETKHGPMCGVRNCNKYYGEHSKGDRVVFLQLRRNMSNSEATELLRTCSGLLETNGIDGITFVDTPEQYRIQ